MVSAALFLITLPVLAALPEASGGWLRAVPPQRDLPAIEVAVGYPGGYIPSGYVPIVLRANAERPFEGAIAFRFIGRGTRPTPVITPVDLKPGQPWSFRTWAAVPGGESKLTIEWRDRKLDVLSETDVARIHEDRLRVLRVVHDTATAPAQTLGEPAYAATPGTLPTEAQWYGQTVILGDATLQFRFGSGTSSTVSAVRMRTDR